MPSGIAVNIAGRLASSAPFGPASRAVIAAVATAFVSGTSRRTGTRPSLPVNDAQDEVGAHDRSWRRATGSGSAWRWVMPRRMGPAPMAPPTSRSASRPAWSTGRPWATVQATGTASRAPRRSAAGSSEETGDATGAAGVPRGPEAGEQAAPASATATSSATRAVVRMAVLTALSSVRVQEASPASTRSMSGASPGGNDPVTGRVSAKTIPPPGRARARSEPPSSAACSAAIARPRPELPAARDGSAL